MCIFVACQLIRCHQLEKMLLETEIRLDGEAVGIRNQGTQKALDLVLRITLLGGATQARGARATFSVLHTPPGSFPPRRPQTLIHRDQLWEKNEYSEGKKL